MQQPGDKCCIWSPLPKELVLRLACRPRVQVPHSPAGLFLQKPSVDDMIRPVAFLKGGGARL